MSQDGEKEFREVPIEKIRSSPLNPRKIFAKEPLEQLSESIKEDGLIEPITIRPVDGKYEVVVGERRLRAAKQAGLKSIPALIREIDDKKALEMMLIENLLRENLEPIETALTYQKLITEFGYTKEEIGKLVKKSPTNIYETLSLLVLPEAVRDKIVSSPKRIEIRGFIPASHAYEIYRLGIPERRERRGVEITKAGLPRPAVRAEEVAITTERQKRLAEKVISKGLTHRAVRTEVSKVKEIDKILETVKNPKVRVKLKKAIEPELFDERMTIKKVKEMVEVETKGFIKEPTYEEQWRSKSQGLRSVHNRYPDTSFIREWTEADRQYSQLILWMDKGEKIPTLIRKDYARVDFATFQEADDYARERGGYCTGIVRIRGVEYWCVFEREKA